MDNLNDQPMQDPLTDRELEVLDLIADGLSNREIAEELIISLGTVKWYNKQIYSKLGVHSRTRALAQARVAGLLDAGPAPAEGRTAVSLPTGTVTFLFTDVEGSTMLWEQDRDGALLAMTRHDTLIESLVDQHNGVVVRSRGEGDSRFAVFSHAGDAVAAAAAIQPALAAEPWPMQMPLRVRMALHTGEADVRMGDYYGLAVNRCARLRAVAHGGQTLLSTATAEIVQDNLPPEASLLPLGEHLLKDLNRPENIFQLTIAGLPADFPPLKSRTISNNLPVRVTPFVGREAELAEIYDLLADPAHRLVSLVGPGGIGKTHLAIQAASHYAESLKQRAHFVSLVPIGTTEFIVQTIAESLPISLSSREDPKVQLLNYLRSKELLLILDTFEHLMDAAGLLSEILHEAPEVTLLVTSRETLNLHGETVYTLTGMDFPEAEVAADIFEYDAVKLFIQGAKHVQPGFEPQEEELQHIAHICRLVEGMPLAIVLASAWIDVLSPQEIAAEISHSLNFLETEQRDVPERQRSIRVVFDTSWKRLTQAEQDLFQTLSVFRAGFTREAARHVAGASPRALAGLVDKSLLRRDPVSGRFEIQQVLRQYAQMKLEETSQAQVSAAAYEAHAAYFADFMQDRWEHLKDNRQKVALTEIGDDIENIRSSWRYWVRQSNVAQLRKFIQSFWLVYEIRGWYHPALDLFSEAADALRDAAEKAEGDESNIVLALILAQQAWFSSLLGVPEKGLPLAEDSIATLRHHRHAEDLLMPLQSLIINCMNLRQHDKVTQAAQEGLDLARDRSDAWWEAVYLSWLASAALGEANYDEAEVYGEAALRIVENTGELWGLFWPQQALAGVALAQGNYEEAKEGYRQSLSVAENILFRRGLYYTHVHLGDIAFLLSDFKEAEQHFLQSLKVSEELGQTSEMLGALYDIARVWVAVGRKEDATELLTLVAQHPAGAQLTLLADVPLGEREISLRDRVEGLLTQLESGLDGVIYRIACKRGQNQELEVVAANILRELLPATRAGAPSSSAGSDNDSTQLPAFLEEEISFSDAAESAPRFVGRDRELVRLSEALEKSLAGHGQVVFVTGGAGRGKTALVGEFQRRAQATHPDLVVVTGNGNALTGIGDPYLPFREVMGMLAGDIEAKRTAGVITREHAHRLWDIMPHTAQALVDQGPDLIDVFVSGSGLLSRAANAAPAGAFWQKRLSELVERKQDGSNNLVQNYLFEQYANVLLTLGARQPLLVVLDDLQWADAASISLLFHLGRRLEGSRVLLVGNYRPDEVALGRDGDRHPLDKVLGEFKRTFGDIWVDLRGANESEGQGFVEAFLDTEANRLDEHFRQALFQHTGGHPLFTVELLRAMQERGDLVRDADGQWIEGPVLDWETLPARIEGVIEERIGRLEANLRDTLSIASVEGEYFTAQTVARVQEVEEWQLVRVLSGELEKRHRLVREREEINVGSLLLLRYQFTHILFQRYLYNGMSVRERRLLHSEIAQALEDLYEGRTDEITLQLAQHYLEAGMTEEAIVNLHRAGERAMRISAYHEAITFFERALGLMEGVEEPAAQHRKVNLLRELGSTYHSFGEWDVGTDYLKASLSLARELGDEEGTLKVLNTLGLGMFKEGKLDQTEALLEDALSLGRKMSDQMGMVRALIWLGSAIAFSRREGAYAQSMVCLKEALELIPADGDRALRALALHRMGEITRIYEKYSDAKANYEKALGIYQEIENQPGIAFMATNLGHVAAATGDDQTALDSYHEALQVTTTIGLVPVTLELVVGLAGLHASAGDPEHATEWLGLVLAHPALQVETKDLAERLFTRLEAELPAKVFEAALAHGKQLNLKSVTAEILDLG
jgi:predicted ATPase/class 3 adenylate cyclase